MRQRLRTGPMAALVLALAAIRPAVAQQTAAPARPAGAAATAARPADIAAQKAMLNQVMATVNGEPINRGELIRFLSQFPLPAGNEKEIYERGLELLANNHLTQQFLKQKRVVVTEKDFLDEVAKQERMLKAQQNRDFKTAIAEAGFSMDEVRAQMEPVIAIQKYINEIATDARLKRFAEENKDVFEQVLVKASHILVMLPTDAPPAKKEEARQKLVAIKAQILAGRMTFADAANKYSEDDANKTSPNGGDLGYFARKGQINEIFSAKAFSLLPQTISEPIETEYGLHLIQVTDRKPGTKFDFEQNKAAVLNQFRAQEMERIVTEMRKTAKVEIKPMPDDLFPKAPPSATPAPRPGAPITKPQG